MTHSPGTEPDTYLYSATVRPADPAMIDLLRSGAVEVLGRMPWSSNGTFLVEVTHGEDVAPAVYKPERGERPLWDFPAGLWRREVAAYELSEALGFGVVPPTVERDGDEMPFGTGSLQAFVPAEFDQHYFLQREREDLLPQLRRLCAFDLVANSTDRKGGHCLLDDDGRIWAIDNGLSFHEEFKLRTVIWDFAGEFLPSEVADALSTLLEVGPPASLVDLLSDDEVDALIGRARRLLSEGRFPHDDTGRRHPWPLV